MLFLMVLLSVTVARSSSFCYTFQCRATRSRLFSTISHVSIPSGIFAVYKPKDWTSNDAVQKLRLMLQAEHRKRTDKRVTVKVGHGGTLDPIAEGVLVIGIGEGTKILSEYLSGSKGYTAGGCFGTEYDTLDRTGTLVETKPFEHITRESIQNVIPKFTGDIMQVPPMFSALKRDGKTLYDLARKGIEVEREARPVKVYSLKLSERSNLSLPHFELEVECGGGFYIRSLISDMAKQLDSAAFMTELVRTKQGVFTIDDCLRLDKWDYDSVCEHILKCSRLVNLDASTMPKATEGSSKPQKYFHRRK